MPLALAVGVPAGCAKPRAGKCLRLANERSTIRVLFKLPDLAFTLWFNHSGGMRGTRDRVFRVASRVVPMAQGRLCGAR